MNENRISIRLIAAALTLAAWSVSTTVQAAPWCGTYRNGSTNCGFSSREQCQAAMMGGGGFCNQNPSESGAERPAARKERKVEPKPKRIEKESAAPAEKSVAPPAAAQPAPAPPAVVQQPASAQQLANNFEAARALVLSGKYAAGIAAMKSLGYDDHPDVASSIGFAYAKLGNLGEARAWYNKALAGDPNHLSTWGYSGTLYVVQGDIAKARGDLEHIKSICGGTACREYRELESLIAAKAR